MKKIVASGIIFLILVLCLSGCTLLFSRQLWRNSRTIHFERRYYLDNRVSLELPTFHDEYSSNKDKYHGWLYTKWKGPGMGDIPASEIYAFGRDGKGGTGYDTYEMNVLYVKKYYEKLSSLLKGFQYTREAFIIVGNKYFKFFVYTDSSDYMLPDVEEKKMRIKEDDKIFAYLVDSLRINIDGTWVRPEIIWKGPKNFEYMEYQ